MSELTFLDHTRGDERSLCFYKIRIRIIDLSFKFCTIMILHYYLLRIERRCFWEIASFKQIADFGHLQQLHQEETVYYLRFPITSGGNRVFSTFFGWFSQQLQTAQASTLRTKISENKLETVSFFSIYLMGYIARIQKWK